MNNYMLQASFLMLMVATGQLFGASSSGCQPAEKPFGVPYSEDASLAAVHNQLTKKSIIAASGSTSRSIDTFDSEVQGLCPAIQGLSIAYLPNSKLDRLRVKLPLYGAPAYTSAAPMVEEGSFEYVKQVAPIALSPLKIVTIGQILNANPFKREHLPTARKWLAKCAAESGIADIALEQRDVPAVDPAAPTCSTASMSDETPSQAGFIVSEAAAGELLRAHCLNQRRVEEANKYLPKPETAAQRREIAILFGEVAATPARVNDGGRAQSIFGDDSSCNLL
jgi:hypothetical protein